MKFTMELFSIGFEYGSENEIKEEKEKVGKYYIDG